MMKLILVIITTKTASKSLTNHTFTTTHLRVYYSIHSTLSRHSDRTLALLIGYPSLYFG